MAGVDDLIVGHVYDVTIASEGRSATFRARYAGPLPVDALSFFQGNEDIPPVNWNWGINVLTREVVNVQEVTLG